MTIAVIEPDWPAPAHVRAAVTTRAGGVSVGPYASLNLGAHVGDAPTAVAANRRRLAAALALPGQPHWLTQVHGSDVVPLDGAPRAGHTADAAYTRNCGVVCCVQTADCLPVLLTDRAGTVVGIAHAGWRGLAGDVLGNLVAAMAIDPAALVAWLGPAISQPAYEVGAEVRDACLARDPAAAGAFAANARGRWQADLYALARGALGHAGVDAVYGGGSCTFADAGRFFSHRRVAPCGRMASLIWLASDRRAS
jgi:purine-nucleoside/S-methyl-5'-thioadenosine phosphorylase / adenosine deaminase